MAKEKLKEEMFLKELGFSAVVEEMIRTCSSRACPFIGHNMMYDILYFYNQFIGPLPENYEAFAEEWHQRFPDTYDTKVLSFKADYFGKTVLGKVYEKCQFDKKIKDVLKFQYDTKKGFTNYQSATLETSYHEAAFDSTMTGYAFAKILKYKEIDEIYAHNRQNKGKKAQNAKTPVDVQSTEIDLSHSFARTHRNKVMMN